MEPHPTPFPVNSQYMKPKPTKKTSDAPKTNAKGGPLLLREKRVFGTARNPNIPSKPALERPAKAKPPSKMLKKPTKTTRSPLPAVPPEAEAKNSSEEKPARLRSKSVCFQENEIERNGKLSGDGNVVEPLTPAKSPAVQTKTRRSATPYRTAEKCSKCRFDRLETSAYWLDQIKLAEPVAKHSVSAAFFRLAFECKAEPIRNVRVELKKYLARHEHLNAEDDWKKLLVSYGLVKEERCVNSGDAVGDGEEENAGVQDQQDQCLPNEISQENES